MPANTQQKPSIEEAVIPQHRNAEQPCILIVDDEPNILSTLRRLLRREPYDIACANSASEAIKIIESRDIQVVITDYRMPETTGVDLLREVQRRWPDIVRIVLSGFSEVKAIIAAINDGAVYKYLTKPWNDESLKLNIRRAVELSALEAENRRLTSEVLHQNDELRRLNHLLDQKASDASTGLRVSQQLLEAIDAGVIAVDSFGLIVMCNQRALEMLSLSFAECLGEPANSVFPDTLYDVLQSDSTNHGIWDNPLDTSGRMIEWRKKEMDFDGNNRGTVFSFWGKIQ